MKKYSNLSLIYIFSSSSCILFRSKILNYYKVDFQSMMNGEMVLTTAIDAWSCFLNSQEVLRAPSSPMRLFCYTETSVKWNICYIPIIWYVGINCFLYFFLSWYFECTQSDIYIYIYKRNLKYLKKTWSTFCVLLVFYSKMLIW